MKKVFISSWLALFSIAFAYSQGKELDSLKKELEKHPQEDTLRVKILRFISHYESDIDLDAAENYAKEALRISKKINYLNGIGFSYKSLAQNYQRKGDYDRAIECIQESEKAFESTGDNEGKVHAMLVLAGVYLENKEYDKSFEEYKKCLTILDKENLKVELGYLFSQIAGAYSRIQKYDSAEKYCLQGLKVLTEIGHREGMELSYTNLGDIYLNKKEYEKAIASISAAFALMDQMKIVNTNSRIINHANLAIVYTRMGKFQLADASLQKAESLARNLSNKGLKIELLICRIDLEKERGNFKDALRYTERKDQLKDSLFNIQKAAQITTIQTRFDVQKKEQTIHSLQQQEQIQNLKQWFLTGSLLLVVVVSLLIYLLQRANHKKVRDLLLIQQDLNSRLRETDEIKSRFFANISHEFRTPLSLIITPIENELRVNESLPIASKNLYSQINRNAHQLLSLVNDLLDLSKLDMRKMELWVKRGDLSQFITVLAASFDSLAENKGIVFHKSISAMEGPMWFDAEKIEKILNNLFINAFKFTPAGKSISFQALIDPTGNLQLTVADQGIGISPEDQRHIFSSYYQVRGSSSEIQGTGLGLALVKELVDLYKGRIHLESQLGEGTSIQVTLPISNEALAHAHFVEGETKVPNTASLPTEMDHAIAEPEEPVDTTDKPTVLIVEDHKELRRYIGSVIHANYSILEATDGEEAWTLAMDKVPDLIISDVMMPRMSGIELCGRIKTDERTSHIPVLLLTAKADFESRMTGLKTGADDYLAKPFSTEELQVRTSNLLEQRRKLAEKYRQQISAVRVLPVHIESNGELSIDEKFLNKARELVYANLDNTLFGVEAFAAGTNLSRAQLFRKLKAIVGISPNEFINEIRLQRASEMIKAKTDTLSQIAYAVGFNDQSYFAKRFKKKFGVSPSDYASDTHAN
ncbi:MAG: response regulator [Bacteroidetes bacterium]|nr:response regulator [Bacteroidota bacterium]